MPREQGHSRDNVPHSTSKTAKDKSNADTLHSERDSEKDSGYSEAGSDDQRSSRSEPVRDNSKVLKGGRPYGGQPSMYVFKNLLVKPSPPAQLLAWRGAWGLDTQLVLVPQSSAPTPPPLKKGGGRSSQTPILKSYPRIAPHPPKGGPEAGGAVASSSEGQSQRKRGREDGKCDVVSSSGTAPLQSAGVDSSSQTPPPPPSRRTSARQRRFLNTADILQQSGLLAITLRTKELLQQNAATDRQLAQLRHHTQLLCQAARCDPGSAPGPGPAPGLDRLLQAMTQSGCYPGLQVQGGSPSLPDQDTSPPSPLLAPSPEPPPAGGTPPLFFNQLHSAGSG